MVRERIFLVRGLVSVLTLCGSFADYRTSMLPMESAAIIRGLLRVHNATDALDLLHDELSLPMEVSMR